MNRTLTNCALASLVLLVTTTASTASALDFRFRVPLDLNALHPSVLKVGVACQVFAGSSVVASGQYQLIDLAGKHDYHGTFNYDLNYAAGKSGGTSYKCQVIFYTAGASVTPGVGSDPAAYHKDGTPYTPNVSGSL